MRGEEIAIIGLAIRAPMAETVSQYWDNLVAARECLTRTADRGAMFAQDDEHFVASFGALANVRGFDHEFFGYRPAEAAMIDPQHRIFLECAAEALESGGYSGGPTSHRIGVFAACGFPSYLVDHVRPGRSTTTDSERLDLLLSNDKDFLAARVAYKLNLTGPAIVTQAACASSLASVHMACESVLLGGCELALAGGVAVDTRRNGGYFYEPGLIFAKDGRVRSFDRHATGTVPSMGCGVILLKRLVDALRDGDTVYATILGSAITNDGGSRVGFTAPSVDGVMRAAQRALAIAEIEPSEVQLIEAHGSGTPLGDRTEITALSLVYGASHAQQPCWLGSVKTNIGHLDVASGVAGLIKTALSLHHNYLPASLNCQDPIDEVARSNAPLRVLQEGMPWPSVAGGRKAAISSMGLGGHNVHMLLGEAPPQLARPPTLEESPQLLIWSAHNDDSGRSMGEQLSHAIADERINTRDTSFSLTCRTALPVRYAATGNRDELRAQLRRAEGVRPAAIPKTIIFQFPGIGERPLVSCCSSRDCQTLVDTVESCRQYLITHFGESLALEVTDALQGTTASDESLFGRAQSSPMHSLPAEHGALFIWELALARQFDHWGVGSEATREFAGFSLGEFAAATMAGVFEWGDALRVVIQRAQLVARLCPRGGMLAVAADVQVLRGRLVADLHVAIDGGPMFCVVGGPAGELELLRTQLLDDEVACQFVATDWAFHTRYMTPALDALRQVLQGVSLKPPREPYHSALLGRTAGDEVADIDYWLRHLVEPVLYRPLLDSVFRRSGLAIVELGLSAELTALTKQGWGAQARERRTWIGSCATSEPRKSGSMLLRGLGELWKGGIPIRWTNLFAGEPGRRIPLPTYQFRRTDHWIPAGSNIEAAGTGVSYTVAWPECEPGTLLAPTDLEFVVACVPGAQSLVAATKYEIGFDPISSSFCGFGRHVAVDDVDGLLNLLERVEKARLPRCIFAVQASAFAPEDVNSATRVAAALLTLVKALSRGGNRQSELLVRCDRASTVVRGDRSHPIGRVLAACTHVLSQEQRETRIGFLDVPDSDSVSSQTVPARFSVPHGEMWAWRAGRMYRRVLRPHTCSLLQPQLLRQGGVYVITGGGGRIGHILASFLISRYGARVIILGRHATTSRISEARKVDCDVTNSESILSGLRRADVDRTAVSGVFHLAGVTDEAIPLEAMTREELERHLHAKCRGAAILDRVFADVPLDFVALFSSTTSVLGGVGLYGYAAANAWLDAFAEVRAQSDRPWVSLCWDGWSTESSTRPAMALQQYYFKSATALKLLEEALVRGVCGQLVFLNGSYRERLASSMMRAGHARPATRAAVDATHHEDVVSSRPHRSRESDGSDARALLLVWSSAFGRDVDMEDDFFRLGGDSLLAARIASAVRKQWGVRIPLPEFIRHPTPRAMLALVRDRLTVASAHPAADPIDGSAAASTRLQLATLTPDLNRLALLYMANVIRLHARVEATAAEVLPRYRRLYDSFALSLQREASTSQFSDGDLPSSLSEAEIRVRNSAGDSIYRAVVEGFIRLGRSLQDILSGREDPAQIVFDGADESLASIAYKRMPEAVRALDQMQRLLRDFVARRSNALSVLEIGGGLGAATEWALKVLPVGCQYLFTDISTGFFPAIRSQFPELACAVLDINADFDRSVEGRRSAHDVVIAVNVLHCARAIEETLARIRRIVAPGGAIVLVEAVQNEPWHLVTMGTLKGFLDSVDWRSERAGPLLSATEWRHLLVSAGFPNVQVGAGSDEVGQVALLAS